MLKRPTIMKSQHGLTLVEVLVVLVLLSIVAMASMQLFHLASTNWNKASASSMAMLDASRLMQDISYDVRSAQKFAESGASSVKILNTADGMPADGAGIAIYHINTDVLPIKYDVVFYWVDSNKNLHRGLASTDTATAALNLTYNVPAVSDKTIARGVTVGELFRDTTVNPPAPAPPRERREIAVNLTLEDIRSTPRFAAINLNSSYLTRSQEIGALTPTGSKIVKVSGIDMVFSNLGSITYNSSLNSIDVPRAGGTFNVTASFTPANATNQNLTWSKNDPWITLSNNHTATITVTISDNNSFLAGSRDDILTLTADDGNWTCNIAIRQADWTGSY